MLLVDSTVWIDYFNGAKTPETDFLDRILGEEIILVGCLIPNLRSHAPEITSSCAGRA
jgi:hypothetical protein